MTGSTGERRPLATRDARWAQRVAAFLVARRVSPNAISVLGMCAALAAGGSFATTSWVPDLAIVGFLAGAALVQLRLLANMLDGMVALGRGTASPVGELYNEVPDRVSDVAILVGLGYGLGGDPMLGFGASLAAVFTAYVRAMGGVAGAPQAFHGPLAKPQRMFVVTVTALIAAVVPGATDAPWQAPRLALWIVTVGSLVTAVRRIRWIAGRLREVHR